jgi:hypothetical protein
MFHRTVSVGLAISLTFKVEFLSRFHQPNSHVHTQPIDIHDPILKDLSETLEICSNHHPSHVIKDFLPIPLMVTNSDASISPGDFVHPSDEWHSIKELIFLRTSSGSKGSCQLSIE